MEKRKVHTVVLGAGPGGYVAAIRLAQLGVETLLVEKESLGGVCLNVGCIPSKALIHVARSFEQVNHLGDLGIQVGPAQVDFAKTQTWKNKVVSSLTSGIRTLVNKNGATILMGTGTFSDAHTLLVEGADGNTQVEFQNCILACGSSPIEVPALPPGPRVLDSTGALQLDHVPQSLVVVGGGYIGLELGFVYRKLGSQVTVVEMMDSVLPGFDGDVVRAMERKLKKDGFRLLTKTRALGCEESATGLRLKLEQDGKQEMLECSYAVVCVGRRPNSTGYGLESTGVQLDERGFVRIDGSMRSSVPHIFAIGDLAGQPMLAHHASFQGEIAAEVIAGHRAADHAKVCPAVVFTDPEIAVVGMSEAQAAKKGIQTLVAQFPFAALGKAKAQNETDGFVKIIADKGSQEVLGMVIVGHNAGDLIGEALIGIEMGAVLEDFAASIHPHPTLTESIMEAAKKALGQAIHVLN